MKTNAPKLRFKGFENSWESTALSFVMSEFIVPMRDKPKIFDGNVPWTRIEDIEGRYLRGTKSGQFVSQETINSMNLKVIPKNSLIVSASASFGIVAIVTTDLITNQTFIGLVPNRQYDLDFLYMFFQTKKARDYMKEKSAGSTIFYINQNDFKNMVGEFPELDEQKRIGELFLNLDTLIEHDEKYIALTKDVKNSLLNSLFVKDKSSIPSLRFKGFNNCWKQCKLGEMGEFKSNGVDKLSRPDELPVNLLNYMDVYSKRKITKDNCHELMHVTAKQSQKSDNNVLASDVFFTPTSETADDIGHVMVIEEDLPNTVYSYHLMRYRPFEGSFYMTFPNYGLATNYVRNQMSLMAQGVQRFVLSKSQFESINCFIPDIKEQQKIADLLTNVDNLILLRQRKLDSLKNLRSSLLEKVFPN